MDDDAINAGGFNALIAMIAGHQQIVAAEPDPEVDDLAASDSEDDAVAGAYSEGDSDDDPADEIVADPADEIVADDAPALVASTKHRAKPPPGIIVEPDGKLDLEDDPRAAIAVNNAHRRADVPDGAGSDLYPIEQVCALLPRQYKYPVQTFAPQHWPTATPITQAEYDNRFAAEFPEIAHILPLDNIVVAGGSAAFPLGDSATKVGDVDLYVYGVEPADQIALWTVVNNVVRKIRRAHMRGVPGCERRAHSIVETMSPGCVTLRVCYTCDDWRHRLNSAKERKVQIILRAFPSVSSILHGFDVPSCCVAYDGRVAATTTLGAFAAVFRCNPVVPAYRSTTYERRLEKYFTRGYALVLPDFRRDTLKRGVPFEMPHLTLVPRVVRGLFAVGTLALPPGSSAFDSDYGAPTRKHSVWSISEIKTWYPKMINARQISNNARRFVVIDIVEKRRRRWRGDNVKLGLPFGDYCTAEPSLTDILPRLFYEELLASQARSAVNSRGHINIRTLGSVFNLNSDEISKLVCAVTTAVAANPKCKYNLAPALARFQRALVERYDAMPNSIDWWIVTDPSRQYTGSINPIIEDPAQWYGDVAFDPNVPPATSDDFVLALMATLEARAGGASMQTVYDGLCPLCHGKLNRGEANSVILACGHIFHWSESDECPGLFDWVVENHNCPTCRQQFAREEVAAPAAAAAIQIDVAW
jgi:hypothetical protein